MEYRYSIKTRPCGTLLNPDTFCPGVMRQIDLIVYGDAQHDGHGWTESDIRLAESKVVDAIMQELRTHVEKHVKDSKPFAIHYYKD